MEEEIDFLLESTKEQMQQSIDHLKKSFRNIRAGKASPSMLGSVMVDYYHNLTPLQQVANVSTPDAQTIKIQPWEKGLLPKIEKAVLTADLGFNPMNNGEQIMISIPILTGERRQALVKMAKSEVENTKISIRTARKDANDELKKMGLSKDNEKDAAIAIQDITNRFVAKTESLFKVKEEEITTV